MKLTWAILITLSLHLCALFLCDAKKVVYKKSNFSQNLGQSYIKATIQFESPKLKLPNKSRMSKKVKSLSKSNNSKVDKTFSKTHSGRKTVLAKYLTQVRSVISKNKFKSRIAKKFNLKGSVKVAFEINEDSQISDLKLLQSSKLDPIDDSALETIKRTHNLPLVPKELAMKNIPIELEIVYE